MIRHRLRRSLLAIIFAAVLIAPLLFFYAKHYTNVFEPDEAAWIYSTPYFHHYVEGQWDHPDWKDRDAVDHPPLAKYIFGASLALHGERVEDLSLKHFWQIASVSRLLVVKFWVWLVHNLPLEYVRHARQAVMLFSCINLLLLFLIVRRSFSMKVAILATLFTAYLPEFALWSTQAVAGPILLTWTLAGLLLTLLWSDALERRATGAASWCLAVAIGLIAGLGFSTKFNGALILATPAWAGIAWARSAETPAARKAIVLIAHLILIALVGFGVMILINPAIAPDPLAGLHEMFTHRVARVMEQGVFSGEAFLPLWGKGIELVRALFDNHGMGIGFLLGALLVTLIVFSLQLPRREPYAPPARRRHLIIFTALLWVAQSLWSFSMLTWERYLFPAWPWLALAGAVAADRTIVAWSSWRGGRFPTKRAVTSLLISCGIFASLWIMQENDWERDYLKRHPLPPAFFIKQLESTIPLKPRDTDLIAELAWWQAIVGDTDAARANALKALAIDPEHERAKRLLDDLGAPPP